MRSVVQNLISWSPQLVADWQLWVLIAAYAVLLLVTLTSVATASVGRGKKVFWGVFVVVVPVLGIAVYCVRCIATAQGGVGEVFARRRQLVKHMGAE